jgi:adenine-specific DNA methylase
MTDKTETWDKLPLNLMDELAEKETYRRDVYRPIYSLHKWWARRPGSTFRCLGLAAMTDDTITKDDILTERTTGTHYGLYLDSYHDDINPNDEHIDRDVTVLDPFAGGGTTLVESNRLGADVIGYELNPVAWWTEKKSMDDVDLDVLQREFDRILEEAREELGNYYITIDPETGQECEVLYYFQSQRIPCLTCDEEVQLFPRYQLAKTMKTRPGALYCPNQNCDARIIELENRSKGLDKGTVVTIDDEEEVTVSEDGNEICPNCGHEFDPSDGTYGYGKYTCSNGHKHDVKETLQRRDERPTFDRFAIQYVGPRGNKRIKEFDEDDAKRVERVDKKLQDLRDSLPIPEQKIPEGDKSGALLNYNYEEFSELFTDRHLLTFALLLEKARSVSELNLANADEENISEFLITTISASLEYNSKLCRWHAGNSKGISVFERHAFSPKVQPVEPNPLNSAGNISSLSNFFDKVYEAKQYCERPFEKVKNRQKGKVEQFYVDSETISEDRVAELNCKTAERINKNDESVDFVVTDPPYYDNVQYSELSDYFYVWLRECLKDEYDEFKPELVPKAREIVANNSANKDEEFFVESLSNVFSECHRVLKQDGEMVFTYHHNENEAWSVILEALIRSGFTVTGAYPVQSEMPNNPHISDLDNAEYDILVYANKEQADEEITLTELRQNLFFELQDMAAEERERHEDLSKADLGVILRGKCMYYYSRYYPNVYSEGEQAGIDEALETVDSIIEQVLEGSINLPASIDSMSEAYAAFVQRGPEGYDDLNKQLLAKNLNVSELEDEKLVKGPRDRKEPVPADERVHHIERKLSKSGNGSQETLGGDEVDDALLDIDKVQYLYHLYITDQNTTEYLSEWKSSDLEELAEFMSDATGDDRYESVMEMSLSQF